MFGYSMTQMVRKHADKLDRPLREEILNVYKPFKWIPCFLHQVFEGYFKKNRKISVIIEFENGSYDTGCKEVHDIMKRHRRNKINHYFSRVSCCSANVTPNGLEAIFSSCQHIKRIYINREVKALLDVAVEAANAKNITRNNTTLTGKGTKIAVIDTGVYPHQDLAGRITDFVDFVNNRTEPYDDNGHGTHCAGDAAGNGEASASKYKGPAPEASIAGVKVLDKMGSGSLETVMQGIDWCIQYNENNPNNPIDIISMSLGSTAQDYGEENKDPMVQMVEEAWATGIVVCVAAGNEGPEPNTIASPGISDQIITVGALDDKNTANTRSDDEVANFSSRGPTIYGLTKPDILAPGVNIVSLRAPNSYLDKLQGSSRVGEHYFQLSGTSMATPLCAGVVALIKQSNPRLTPKEVKDLLKSGADLWRDRNSNVYGAGYINAQRSMPSN
ncbi:S8 family peptidase [Salinibacillus xinjiangensis]|uniref:S8 family serine peptidase n=1 Tax=Salinibacillus xinjiangensis TaxID=1229268 RepID=A0A6G1XAD1_9BACI|nr:S8 family peptidase [Salinibacillus xinjiangensis]MRG87897.1 S8 family serine peptidase [Salinibacillus xinjiangensis]